MLSWPTWCQDVPKMASLELKMMGNLARFYEHLGDFLTLGRDLPKTCENHKIRREQNAFESFFVILGLLEAWRYVGLCWAIWAQLSDETGPKSAKMS